MEKLLLLGSQMETGGAQRVLLAQAEWFHKKGYAVTAAFLYDKEGLQELWAGQYGFPIVNLRARLQNTGRLKNLFCLAGGGIRLARRMFSEKYDAIETYTHHSNLIGLPVAAVARIPVRIASHHGRINRFPRWLETLHALLVNSGVVTCLVAVSEGVHAAAVAEGVNPAKIVTILNGVSAPPSAQSARADTRTLLGIPEDAPLVITVGRLSREKGHLFLIRSISGVIEKHPKTRFLIVGDGALRQELEKEAETLGVSACVRFLGVRTDVPDLLAAADLFVLPSLSEGLPMALLEAMSMEVPVIATDVGGIGGVVKDRQTGLLVPAGDPGAIVSSISELLDDGVKRAQLAASGKELVLQDYSLEKMCEEYERLFAGKKEEMF